jgi:serine acetyltransferase
MARRFGNIREDLDRYDFSTEPLHPLGALRRIWTLPGFQSLAVYRMGRWLRGCRQHPVDWPALVLLPLFWLLQIWVRGAYDIHLEQGAELGAGLYIGHRGGIRVAACRIGQHCAIQHEVRIHPADGECANGPDMVTWCGSVPTPRSSDLSGSPNRLRSAPARWW